MCLSRVSPGALQGDDHDRGWRVGTQRSGGRARRVAGRIGIASVGADENHVDVAFASDPADDGCRFATLDEGVDGRLEQAGSGDVRGVGTVARLDVAFLDCHDEHFVVGTDAGVEVVTGGRDGVDGGTSDEDGRHGRRFAPAVHMSVRALAFGMAGGTYTLVVEVPESRTLSVGALGEHRFAAGWYAYVGSALGPGGFSRIDRHRELAAGQRDTRHWHIDYLLGAPAVRVAAVERTPGLDGECRVAERVDGEAVPDFGCSDCGCVSHLFYQPREDALRESVRAAHEALGDE